MKTAIAMNFHLVINEYDVAIAAGQAARRLAAERLREQGYSWRNAHKAAAAAKPTPEMINAVRGSFERGDNHECAVIVAMQTMEVTK